MLIQAVLHSAPAGAPLIIAGDFNDWGDHLSDVLRTRLEVQEVFDESLKSRSLTAYLRQLTGHAHRPQPARTFPARMPLLRLDRIYVRGFNVETAKVLSGTIWAKLSDHAPVIAELKLK